MAVAPPRSGIARDNKFRPPPAPPVPPPLLPSGSTAAAMGSIAPGRGEECTEEDAAAVGTIDDIDDDDNKDTEEGASLLPVVCIADNVRGGM